MQYKIKEQFRGVPDEFMTHEFALKAKVSDNVDNSLVTHSFNIGIRRSRKIMDLGRLFVSRA